MKMSNVSELTVGKYHYTRPSWDRTIDIIVEKNNDALTVRFSENAQPTLISDIPSDAEFIEFTA
jgi:hypothetical protein